MPSTLTSRFLSYLSIMIIVLQHTSFCDAGVHVTDGGRVELPSHNKMLVISCNHSGNVPFDHWEFNGYELQPNDRAEKEIRVEPYNNSLIIVAAKKAVHEGNYTCVFSNKEFGIIYVRAKPDVVLESKDFVQGTNSINIINGDTLSLMCRPKANESIAKITWYIQPEDESDLPRLLKPNPYDNVAINETVTEFGSSASFLTISPASYNHRAFYTCEVHNGISSNRIRILLRVKDRLAALWPFLGIVAEVIVLCAIIFIYEKRRTKDPLEEEEEANGNATTPGKTATPAAKLSQEVRQRKQ